MEVHPQTNDAYRLLMDGTLAFARAERQGIRIDIQYVKRKQEELTNKIEELEKELYKTSFYRHWYHSRGNKRPNVYSNQQLSTFLYKTLKIEPEMVTKSGQGATDEDALTQLNIPELNQLLQIRKLKKVRDTYLEGFEREAVDGYIHPSFNLHLVRTFRSCIAKGSKVLVAENLTFNPNGTPIELIRVGDHVYCFNDKLRLTQSKVLWAGKTGHKKVVRVYYENYGQKNYLDVTPEHRIRLITGEYVEARNLIGNFALLYTYNFPILLGSYLNKKEYLITKIDYLDEEVDVYDLEIEGYNNFIANELCVHNSSSEPNFQNIPKRDKESMKICRQALYPRPGHLLLEADYSSLEVRISACYSNDPKLIQYVTDPTTDMHRDMAQQIFMISHFNPSNPEHKTLRFTAKNGFVFPQFYGDWYKTCALYMATLTQLPRKGKWKNGQGIPLGKGTLSDHLIAKGVTSINDFINHIKRIEQDFWEVRFPVYSKWKDRWYGKYLRVGYVDLKTGFRCYGPMSRNDVINYPVQGAAFHCLLKSFILMDEIIQRERWKTKLIGQIHDSMILDVCPDELEKVVKTIQEVTCERLKREWNWISVPLSVGIDVTEINGSWAEIKKYV